MHRYLLHALVVLIAVLAVQPAASAGEPTGREVERMAAKFERMFLSLTDAAARPELELERHGDGLYSLRLSMVSTDRTSLEIRDEEDKPLRLLAGGHMASEPTTPSVAVNAIVSSPESPYNIWWAVVNQGPELESRKTTIKITGPDGVVFEASDKVDYEGNTVALFWFNPEVPFAAAGIYTHRTTVKSGGKNLYRFWVE
jgi:hypothetical protein